MRSLLFKTAESDQQWHRPCSIKSPTKYIYGYLQCNYRGISTSPGEGFGHLPDIQLTAAVEVYQPPFSHWTKRHTEEGFTHRLQRSGYLHLNLRIST